MGRGLLLALALALCASAAWFMLLQRPLQSSSERAAAAVRAAAAGVHGLEQQAARYESYRRRSAATGDALKQLTRMIPRRDSLPRLVITLEQMTRQAGVSLTGVRVVGTSEGGPLAVQHLELKLKGRYADLRTLLARFERLAAPAASGFHADGRLIEVTALTLAADQASAETTSAAPAPAPAPLEATVLLQTYSWNAAQPTAPAAGEH